MQVLFKKTIWELVEVPEIHQEKAMKLVKKHGHDSAAHLNHLLIEPEDNGGIGSDWNNMDH